MKHPRIWATVLIVAALPVMVLGYSLAFMCYIPSPTGCFATFDPSRGIPMIMVGGLLILGAVILLTTARAPRNPAPIVR